MLQAVDVGIRSIGAYRGVAPDAILDDPEGRELYSEVMGERRKDSQIDLFTNLTGVGNLEVNAFQRVSDVIVQKSIREGFGLVISESMWRVRPVVAGRAGGISLRMADSVRGILVDSAEACAQALVQRLEHPGQAEELAKKGHERVREHFLLPRPLLRRRSLMLNLEERRTGPRPVEPRIMQDPVCGMAVEGRALPLTINQQTFFYCSEKCRNRFRANPERYLASGAGER